MFVKVDGMTKIHLQLEEQEFARFAYPRKSNNSKSSKATQSHEALLISVGFSAKSVEVKIIFGHTASSLPNRNSKIPLPETLVEAYGEEDATIQTGYKEARQTFMKTMAGRMRKIGSSVRMAAQTGANSNLWRYMPVIYGEEENEEKEAADLKPLSEVDGKPAATAEDNASGSA